MKIKLLKHLMFLGIMLSGSIIFAQTISGTVTDANGPLPGVNVIVKGTTNGVVTDFDGNYSIDNVGSDAILTFSFIGYIVQEFNVTGQSTINVFLVEDANVLGEVVVVGYTTQTRGDITGSVSSVNMDEALKTPVANAAEALQGRVTGVTVTNSAAPGAAPKIVVRGFGTANNTDPLFIIDGVQTSDVNILNSINPADIDQMNVLKDGAAAIYGARASNGVIIVTTKSGGYNMNKLSVSLDVYTGVSKATNLPDNLNVQQHADMIWQSYANDGATPNHPQYGSGATPVIPTQLLGIPANATVVPGGTNWNDVITRSAPTTNVSLSLSNGSDTGKYYMSASYLTKDGILEYTGFERASVMVNGEFKIKDKVRIGEHLNVAFSNGNSGNSEAIENAQRLSPLIPAYDDDGNFGGPYNNSTGLSNTRNALAQLYRGRNDFNKSQRVFGDVYIEVDLYEGLTFKSSYGVSLQNFDRRAFQALDPEHAEPIATNTLTRQDQSSYEWTWSNTLTYRKDFGEHNISALIGYDAVKNGGVGKEISRTGYLFETPDFYNLATGTGNPNVNYAYEYENSLNSVFGNVNYNYQGKYFASVTVRNDKSSRFLGDNKSDTFPSFSAGWLISKEDFFPADGIVSRLKFKGSYGELGNQTLPGSNPTINISSLDQQYANYALDGSSISTGAVLSSIGNPDLKWETSVSTNIGFDMGLFDSKLLLSFEYFKIRTEDLIAQDFSLISTTAIDASAPYVNIGSIENTGYDISLGYNNTWDSGFTFNASANISHYKNEVTDLISAFVVGGGGLRGGAVTRTEVGRSISDFYGRVVTGLDDTGRFTYKDVDNSGTIDDSDREYIGSPHADFTFGVNFAASYKGFDASVFFSGSQGNDLYNYEKIYTDFPTFPDGNRNVRVLDSWTPSNTGATLPALSFGISNNETNPNSFFIEDGSFIRLKNLQFGYTIADDVVGKFGMESVRIYAVGTNLFTITGYDGIDPEVVSFDNLTLGVDNQIYPVASIYSIGINLKF